MKKLAWIVLVLIFGGLILGVVGPIGLGILLLFAVPFFLVSAFIAWCLHGFNDAIADSVDDELRRRGRY